MLWWPFSTYKVGHISLMLHSACFSKYFFSIIISLFSSLNSEPDYKVRKNTETATMFPIIRTRSFFRQMISHMIWYTWIRGGKKKTRYREEYCTWFSQSTEHVWKVSQGFSSISFCQNFCIEFGIINLNFLPNEHWQKISPMKFVS